MRALGWVLALAAVNWGLIGLLNINIVESILGGAGSVLTKIVYILIGVAGVYKIYILSMGKK